MVASLTTRCHVVWWLQLQVTSWAAHWQFCGAIVICVAPTLSFGRPDKQFSEPLGKLRRTQFHPVEEILCSCSSHFQHDYSIRGNFGLFMWQVIELPFSLYSTFVIEARHGFNKVFFSSISYFSTEIYVVVPLKVAYFSSPPFAPISFISLEPKYPQLYPSIISSYLLVESSLVS